LSIGRCNSGELERLTRITELANTGREEYSDSVFWMGSDLSKRLMPGFTTTYAELVISDGWLVANRTEVPFITSDTPAIHAFIHPDELLGMGFDSDLIYPDANRSSRAFLSYCALSPGLAFVSSPLLVPPADSMYRETRNPWQILMLNELMRTHAKDLVISSKPTPYGSLTERSVADLGELVTQRLRQQEGWRGIHIYTETDRCWIPASSLTIEDANSPLITRITFRTDDVDRPRALPSSEHITQLTTFEPSGGGTMLRGARFVQLAIMPSGDTIIESEW
jgi:hypothetical protein